jgi:hypothetical protein
VKSNAISRINISFALLRQDVKDFKNVTFCFPDL